MGYRGRHHTNGPVGCKLIPGQHFVDWRNGRYLETTFRPLGITAVLMSLFAFGPLKCRRMKVVQWDIYPRWTTNRGVICDTVVPVKVEYPRFKIGCKALSKRFKVPKSFEGLIYMIVLGRNGLMCQAVSAVQMIFDIYTQWSCIKNIDEDTSFIKARWNVGNRRPLEWLSFEYLDFK